MECGVVAAERRGGHVIVSMYGGLNRSASRAQRLY